MDLVDPLLVDQASLALQEPGGADHHTLLLDGAVLSLLRVKSNIALIKRENGV